MWEDAGVWARGSHSFDMQLSFLGPDPVLFLSPQVHLWGWLQQLTARWQASCLLPKFPQGSPLGQLQHPLFDTASYIFPLTEVITGCGKQQLMYERMTTPPPHRYQRTFQRSRSFPYAPHNSFLSYRETQKGRLLTLEVTAADFLLISLPTG